MLAKATGYPAHAFIPDLEDSVPDHAKEAARSAVAAAIPALAASGCSVIPRLNSPDTGLFELDLEAVAGPQIAGISVGKIRSPEEVRRIDTLLGRLEIRRGIPTGAIGILPWIETAAAVARAVDVCRSSSRIRWVAFGAEDLTVDMGIPRASDQGRAPGGDDSSREASIGSSIEPLVSYARAAVAIAARAAGAPAFDTPYVHFKDEAGLVRETANARMLGFKGKFAIHPAQLGPINRAFAPTEAEVSRARKVIDAWEAAASQGRGAISLDGEMVDVPVVARARALLREAGTDGAGQR
ncbi:MAG: CoA ester lyase [Chloroflexi bacterium]|nr:CoA ester lyase [Chloroflexota bacterium]